MKYLVFITTLLFLSQASYGQLFQANIANSTGLLQQNKENEENLIANFAKLDSAIQKGETGSKLNSIANETKEFVFINPAVVANVENKQFDLNLGFKNTIGSSIGKKNQIVNMSIVGNLRAGGQLDGGYKEIINDQNFAGGVKVLGALGLQFATPALKANSKSDIQKTTFYIHFNYKERKFKHVTDSLTGEFNAMSTPLSRFGFGFSRQNKSWYESHSFFDLSYSFIIHDNFQQLSNQQQIKRIGSGDQFIQKETQVYLGDYHENIELHSLNANLFLAKKENAKIGVLISPEIVYSPNLKSTWANLKLTMYLYKENKGNTDEDYLYKPELGVSLSFNDLLRSKESTILDDSRWVFGVTKAFYFKSE